MIKEELIDWSCRLPLTPTGKIDFNNTEHNSNFISNCIKPVPIIQKNSTKFSELTDAVKVSRFILKPALTQETAFQLKKLSTHCAIVNRDFIDLQLMFDDYLEDLKDYPLDLIEKACTTHRNSPDKDCDFFPRPGKLKNYIEKDYQERRQLNHRLEILYKIALEPPKLPPPPTFQEILSEADNRIKVEKMMLQFKTSREKPKISTKEEIIPKIIKDKLQENYLTKSQAEEFTRLFYQLFKPEKQNDKS